MKQRKRFRDESDRDQMVRLLKTMIKGDRKMAATLKDLQDAIEEIATAVEADVEQDKKVVEAIDKLLAANPSSPDYQALVDKVKTETAKLAGDNEAVQAAVDSANTPE